MIKFDENPELQKDLLMSLFKHTGVSETEAEQLSVQALNAELPPKPRKTDETKHFIRQIMRVILDEGSTTLTMQRVKHDLRTKFGSNSRPEFLLGNGPSGMRLLELGKNKIDGRTFLIPDPNKFPDWHAARTKFLPPEYYGEAYVGFINHAVARKDFAFLKEYEAYLSEPVHASSEAVMKASVGQEISPTKPIRKSTKSTPSIVEYMVQ